jgi:hypothetical protein
MAGFTKAALPTRERGKNHCMFSFNIFVNALSDLDDFTGDLMSRDKRQFSGGRMLPVPYLKICSACTGCTHSEDRFPGARGGCIPFSQNQRSVKLLQNHTLHRVLPKKY